MTFRSLTGTIPLKLCTAALVISTLSFLFVSCSDSPEEAGKKLSDKDCECDNISLEDDHEKTLAYDKKILSALQAGTITTYEQLQAKENEIRKEVYGDGKSKELDECREELKKMGKEYDLKFAKQDDRQTIRNVYSANQDVCREKRLESMDEYIKERDELEKKIAEMRQKIQR